MDGALVAVPEVDDPTGELKTAVAKFSHNINLRSPSILIEAEQNLLTTMARPLLATQRTYPNQRNQHCCACAIWCAQVCTSGGGEVPHDGVNLSDMLHRADLTLNEFLNNLNDYVSIGKGCGLYSGSARREQVPVMLELAKAQFLQMFLCKLKFDEHCHGPAGIADNLRLFPVEAETFGWFLFVCSRHALRDDEILTAAPAPLASMHFLALAVVQWLADHVPPLEQANEAANTPEILLRIFTKYPRKHTAPFEAKVAEYVAQLRQRTPAAIREPAVGEGCALCKEHARESMLAMNRIYESEVSYNTLTAVDERWFITEDGIQRIGSMTLPTTHTQLYATAIEPANDGRAAPAIVAASPPRPQQGGAASSPAASPASASIGARSIERYQSSVQHLGQQVPIDVMKLLQRPPTPVTAAVSEQRWLVCVTALQPQSPSGSDELKRFFRLATVPAAAAAGASGGAPPPLPPLPHQVHGGLGCTEGMAERIDQSLDRCCEKIVASGRTEDEQNLLRNRVVKVRQLVTSTLETMLNAEEERTGNSNFGPMLGNDAFLLSLIACCTQCCCYEFYNRQGVIPFTDLLQLLHIPAFEVVKMLNSFISHWESLGLQNRTDGIKMPLRIKANLKIAEESILESLSWQRGSELFELLAENSGTFENRKGTAHALRLFFSRVLTITEDRLRHLCEGLRVSEILDDCWSTLVYILGMKREELLKGRHLDQMILCTIYAVVKVYQSQIPDPEVSKKRQRRGELVLPERELPLDAQTLTQITFRRIIQQYNHMYKERFGVLGDPAVYRSVLIDNSDHSSDSDATETTETVRATSQQTLDIIQFYNRIFIPGVKDFLTAKQGGGGGAAAAAATAAAGGASSAEGGASGSGLGSSVTHAEALRAGHATSTEAFNELITKSPMKDGGSAKIRVHDVSRSPGVAAMTPRTRLLYHFAESSEADDYKRSFSKNFPEKLNFSDPERRRAIGSTVARKMARLGEMSSPADGA